MGRARSTDDRLTERQAEVLVAIKAYIEAHGYPPTLREMCASLGWQSTNAASDHLRALERKGYVRRRAHKGRALTVTDKPIETK